MGGGAILIILFNFFEKLDEHLLQGINLIFFIPTAICSVLINIKNKMIDFKIVLFVGFSGIIGAVIGSISVKNINSNNLKRYFGILLLFIAILEIFQFFKEYRIEKNKYNNTNK